MNKFNGVFALDIDGTLTNGVEIDIEVAKFFSQLILQGYLVVLLTGRTFSFAKKAVKHIKGKYFLVTQNGTSIFSMPDKINIYTNYLGVEYLRVVEKVFFDERENGPIIQLGYQYNDDNVFKIGTVSDEELEYMNKRMSYSGERLIPVDSFEDYIKEAFPSIKLFGKKAKCREIESKIQQDVLEKYSVNVITISDPYRIGWDILNINPENCNKKQALDYIKSMLNLDCPVISAGNDNNDLEMLNSADIRVIPNTAVANLIERADVVYDLSDYENLIQSFNIAMKKLF